MDEERIRNVRKAGKNGRHAPRCNSMTSNQARSQGSQETDSPSHRTHRADDIRGCLQIGVRGSAAESHAADVSRFSLPTPTERRTPFSQVSK
jgi:hypothetical protein